MKLSDHTDLRNLNAEILEALKPLLQRNELEGRIASVIFEPDGSSATLRLQVSVQGNNPDAKAFSQFAHLFGMKPEDLNRTVQIAGDTFQIVGLKPNSRKFPVLMKRTFDGKIFTYGASIVVHALHVQRERAS